MGSSGSKSDRKATLQLMAGPSNIHREPKEAEDRESSLSAENAEDECDSFSNFYTLKSLGLLYTNPDHDQSFMRIVIANCDHYKVDMLISDTYIDITFIRNFHQKYPGFLSAENPSESNMLQVERTVARVTPRQTTPAKKFNTDPSCRAKSRYPANTEEPAFFIIDIPYVVNQAPVVHSVSIF
jgi:hypothetical protein